jgi:hypothetical protein
MDRGRPRKPPHNRPTPARRRERRVADIQVRFVYEQDLRGTWFSLIEALDRFLPVLPNEEHQVTRIEFRDLSEL